MTTTLQQFHLPLSVFFRQNKNHNQNQLLCNGIGNGGVCVGKICSFYRRRRGTRDFVVFVGEEDYGVSSVYVENEYEEEEDDEEEEVEPTPEDLENIAQIKRVLELLRKNRDMLFDEVCSLVSLFVLD